MVTGFTSQKLDLIRTYSNTTPYIVGINGVTNINYDSNNPNVITSVEYSIGDINYVTQLPSLVTTFSTNLSGYINDGFEPYIIFPNRQNTFDIKEESKMNLVFTPKVKNELFIERMRLSVFERYSRLSEIKSMSDLINYRNGYYRIIKNS